MHQKSTQIDTTAPCSIGERISSARLARGLSEEQVARRLGVKKSTFINWESNRSEPRPSKMQILAGVLNVPILWLLAGEEFNEDLTVNVSVKETSILTSKLEQLLQHNQQTVKLIYELDSEVRRIQRELDSDLE